MVNSNNDRPPDPPTRGPGSSYLVTRSEHCRGSVLEPPRVSTPRAAGPDQGSGPVRAAASFVDFVVEAVEVVHKDLAAPAHAVVAVAVAVAVAGAALGFGLEVEEAAKRAAQHLLHLA